MKRNVFKLEDSIPNESNDYNQNQLDLQIKRINKYD